MNGKSKCKILKQIRREIAQSNDIDFVTSECKFQGACTGTCPKCEAEVRYLEAELDKRLKAGKVVAVAGVAAALMAGSLGCALEPLPLDDLTPPSTKESVGPEWIEKNWETEATMPNYETEATNLPEYAGVPYIEPETESPLMGDPVIEMGEVPYEENA